jgi:SAM-dependent methyltransferase
MSFDQIRSDWTQLGETDPLWAVLVNPAKRNGRWDVDEFLATGVAEVDGALATLEALTGRAAGGRALDFGCGVGRLSQALSRHYEEVVGVDISAPMLAEARRIDRSGGRCSFLLNDAPDLSVIEDASVDLVFSSLVLQHIPPDLAQRYLHEMARIVRPGGAVVLLLPTATRRTPSALLYRYAPQGLLRWVQTRVLGWPAPMRMHTFDPAATEALFEGHGLRLVGTTDEPQHGPHWNFTRFFWAR